MISETIKRIRRNDALQKIKNKKREQESKYNEIDWAEKDLEEINRSIKNVEYDLKYMFPDNLIILNKLNELKKYKNNLEEKLNLLKKLKNDNNL